ncbi:MAG: 4,5-dihydroxyphthalate decarboxylase [Nitriliruptorales bacterium]|nr:4,5-dihydroxyphthalate decarboxylase [Nitriliruptorales bacterium]
MGNVQLSLALSGYDHTRDLVEGRVATPGIDLVAIQLSIEEIFYRVAKFRDFDVAEFSFAKYVAMKDQDVNDITAIPVFPSRAFRQSSIYIRAGSPLRSPEDLREKRVGVPEWAQTASVWTRSWLHHEVGVRIQEIDWVQAGVSSPGRQEKVPLKIPVGVNYSSAPDRSLTEMLLDGTLDAVLSAHPPEPFKRGTGEIVQLFGDGGREEEAAYYQTTGLYPLMHVVTIKQDVLDAHPWVAGNLLAAFDRSKQNSLDRLADLNASRFPVPWLRDHLKDVERLFGGDPFPYGVEANRATVGKFLQFSYEQGVAARQLEVDDLFAPQTLSAYTL